MASGKSDEEMDIVCQGFKVQAEGIKSRAESRRISQTSKLKVSQCVWSFLWRLSSKCLGSLLNYKVHNCL